MLSNNLNNSHRFNLNTLYQIDSSLSIRIAPSFTYQNTSNRSQTSYQTLSGNKALTNDGFSNSTASNEGYNFRNDMILRKKFARRGRTFSLALQTSLNESNGDGSLFSINNFYNPAGSLLKIDTLNQQNVLQGNLRGYNAKAVYTEPLLKRSLLEFSLAKGSNKSESGKITHDYNRQNSKYDLLNDTLTNNFESVYNLTNAGIRVRTQKRKFSYAFGVSLQQTEMEGKIISYKDSLITKKFLNFLPNARFQYNFSKLKTLTLTYAASTNQPTISQLQPVPDNSNSLNIKEGNPGLKQEYNHTLMGHLNLINPYKNKNLFFYFTLQETQNKIVNYDMIDQFGIKTTKPVNVNGVYNFNSEISYSMPVHFLKGTVEISNNTGYLKTKQFINGSGNDIKTWTLGPNLRFDMNPADKLNIGIGSGFTYNKTNYSLQSALNASYLSKEYTASLDWEMPRHFFLSTDFTYTINSQRSAGFNTKIPLWNASISKQMLKFNRGEIKFSARDILDKNIGISRSTNNNYIEDSRVLILQRFFLLSFTYSLNKTGLNCEGGGDIRVIRR